MIPKVDLREPVIPVAWAGSPFGCYSGDVYRDIRPAGMSLAELAASVPNLPANFAAIGVVCVNGEPVPRAMWRYVRPRVNGPVPVNVTLHVPAGQGNSQGGGGGAKNVFAIVASLALIALTSGIASGAVLGTFTGMLGTSLGIGATAAGQIAAAGVGIIGSLAISALTAPPVREAGEQAAAEGKEPASASGNLLTPGGAIPRVIGTHRVFPPLAAEPLVEIDGDDTLVTATYVLAGPHDISEITVDDLGVGDLEDVETEVVGGWPSDGAPTLNTRQSVTNPVQQLMDRHRYAAEQGSTGDVNLLWSLEDQTTPANSVEQWERFVSRKGTPAEIWLHLHAPGGLLDQTEPDDALAVPFRLRIRLAGTSSWTNFPEIWLVGNKAEATNRAIKLKWSAQPGSPTAIQVTDLTKYKGWSLVYTSVPNPNTGGNTSSDTGWTASSYFYSGSGLTYSTSFETTSGIRNADLFQDEAVFYLDETSFPKGQYEIEVKRGGNILWSAVIFGLYDQYKFGDSTYINSMFGWFKKGANSYSATRTNNQHVDTFLVSRVTSVWNDPPVAAGAGLCSVTLRARNRSMSRVGVTAAGFVASLPAGGSPTWITTSAPAPHFRDVLAGSLNKRALSAAQIDDAGIEAWFNRGVARGDACNAILDGRSVADALTLIASCGYARPYKSEVWGVIEDRDRTGEAPVQVFSPHNLANFRLEKGFPVLPDHFIATFRNEDNDFQDEQVVVYHDSVDADSAELSEAVDVAGLTNEAAVIKRMRFDLRQARSRSTFYSGEASAENVVCRRGDLVAVQHDVLTKQAGSGRVKSVIRSDSSSPTEVTGIVLDSAVPIGLNDDEEDDNSVRTGCAIRLKDGTILTKELTAAGAYTDTLSFAVPFDDPGDALGEGCLAVTGILNREYKRLIVSDVRPGRDLTALLSFVDEAPEIHIAGLRGSGSATIRITATAAAFETGQGRTGSGSATISITGTVTATQTEAGDSHQGSGAATIQITAAVISSQQASHAGRGSATIQITGTAAAERTGNSFAGTGSASIGLTGTATAIKTAGEALSGSGAATISLTGAAAAARAANSFSGSGSATIRITASATATSPDGFDRGFLGNAFR